MTLSRPRSTHRVLRGSALNLGLLIAGGVTAPAAWAIEDTDPDTTVTEVPLEEGADPSPLQEAATEGAPPWPRS